MLLLVVTRHLGNDLILSFSFFYMSICRITNSYTIYYCTGTLTTIDEHTGLSLGKPYTLECLAAYITEGTGRDAITPWKEQSSQYGQ